TLRDIEGLDVAAGVRNALGREALYLTLLGKFVAGQRDFGAHLKAALAESDRVSAERLAHTLKGVSAQIGARPLSAQAEAFEAALRRGDAAEALASPLDALVLRLGALLDALAARLPGERPAPVRVEVDPQALQAVCARLAGELAADDFASCHTLEANEALLRAGLGHRFPVIEEAVRSFDLAAALASLREAAASLDMPL
ncbi:Hpt domain-containing protein, partial [Zoogloea sp.]|uniref:Hpt domain-containing protein n=1 Tax=Zoogloea sp. TaxID=49181 RepID=UPI0035B3ABB3